MSEKKFNFVYVITNLINNKKYIGDHSTNNLNDRYLGSGVYLNHAIKKCGKNNFHIEILEYFNCKEDAFNAQEKYIIQFNTIKPNGYNLSPKGGLRVSGCFSDETLKKIGNVFRGKTHTQETKNKISQKLKGRVFSKETLQKMSNGSKGKKLSEETKQKMSSSHIGKLKGKKLSEETKQKMSIARKGRISPMKGKKMSDEAKLKISKSKRGYSTTG